jgi:alanine racemase
MANTWLELDRGNLLHNLARLRAVVHPARLMPVVKANAYGAGAIPIATALAGEGVDAFAVASVPEAVELRQAGIAGTILVLTYFDRDEVDAILEHDLRPGVFTADAGRWLSEGARRRGVTAHVWVKVDTGLGRLGVPHGGAPELVREVAKQPSLTVDALFSTLAETPERNRAQVARLREVRAELSDISSLTLSIASSQGILSMPESWLDVVRPGMALLGVAPHAERLDAALVRQADLRPVVTWKARVAYVKVVPRGEYVGYGPRPVLERDTPIATLAVGWADGYPQTLQGAGHVLLRGRRCSVLAISANSTMVDLTGVDGVAIDDEAVLIGHQGDETIPTAAIAAVIGSFYRVLATIPARVPRGWSRTAASETRRTETPSR